VIFFVAKSRKFLSTRVIVVPAFEVGASAEARSRGSGYPFPK
jgi:hypothetical protein